MTTFAFYLLVILAGLTVQFYCKTFSLYDITYTKFLGRAIHLPFY